jgi:hypothetical protein
MTRIVRGRAPGTSISTEQIKGVFAKPTDRAAAAGKAELRSGLEVKRTEITSSGVSEFTARISRINSWVAEESPRLY